MAVNGMRCVSDMSVFLSEGVFLPPVNPPVGPFTPQGRPSMPYHYRVSRRGHRIYAWLHRIAVLIRSPRSRPRTIPPTRMMEVPCDGRITPAWQ